MGYHPQQRPYPIFSGFENAYQIRAAQVKVDPTNAQLDTLSLRVALDVWTERYSVTAMNHFLRMIDNLFASAEQSVRVALGL